MIELQGKYNSCKVFTDELENSAIGHLMAFLNQESMLGSKIRIMPDVHDGKGSVIGTTMTITDRVIPSVVGCDVGCGMLTIKLKEKRVDLTKLDSVIRKYVDINRSEEHNRLADTDINSLYCGKGNVLAVQLGLGTMGGGNHFIELNKDDTTGDLYLVIHSGSRNLGVQVEKFYQNLAYEEAICRRNGGTYQDKALELSNEYKRQGRAKEIGVALSKLKKEYKRVGDVPYELAYVTGTNFESYLHDMRITQDYAISNRRIIADTILSKVKLHEVDSFETIHNYIDLDNGILRKGSVSARNGEILLIPINMRDGSLICRGKGNPDWNYSAPHGAGRLFSRADSKTLLTVSEFRKMMSDSGVYTTSVGRGTLSESPLAYKPMESILANIADTVDVLKIIRPVYNYKSGCEEEES